MKKAFVIAVSVVAAFFALINLGETFSIQENIGTYKHLYGLNPNEPYWQFRSVANLKTWHYLLSAYNISLLALCLVYLKLKRKWMFTAIAIISCIAMTLFIRYQVLWIESGYDHYPGFDPYLF